MDPLVCFDSGIDHQIQDLRTRFTAISSTLCSMIALPLAPEVKQPLQRLSGGVLSLQTALAPINPHLLEPIIYPPRAPSGPRTPASRSLSMPATLKPVNCSLLSSEAASTPPIDRQEYMAQLMKLAVAVMEVLVPLKQELEVLLQTHNTGGFRAWYSTELWREKKDVVGVLLTKVVEMEDIISIACQALDGDAQGLKAFVAVVHGMESSNSENTAGQSARTGAVISDKEDKENEDEPLPRYQKEELPQRSELLRRRNALSIRGQRTVSAPITATSSPITPRNPWTLPATPFEIADKKYDAKPHLGSVRKSSPVEFHPKGDPICTSAYRSLEHPFSTSQPALHRNLEGLDLKNSTNELQGVILGPLPAENTKLQEEAWDAFARAEREDALERAESNRRRHTVHFEAAAEKVGWLWSKTTRLWGNQKKHHANPPAEFPAASVWISTAEVRITTEMQVDKRWRRELWTGAIPVDIAAGLKRWLDEEIRCSSTDSQPTLSVPAVLTKRSYPLVPFKHYSSWASALCTQDMYVLKRLFWRLPRENRVLVVYLLSVFRFLVQKCHRLPECIATLFLPYLIGPDSATDVKLGQASAMATGLAALIVAVPGFLDRQGTEHEPDQDKAGRKLREALQNWQDVKTEVMRSSSEVVNLPTLCHVYGELEVGETGWRDNKWDARREV